ncbi:MAG: response regulator [Deltaproteobacteria bacterium]|nr:response regulator [Deltaproteobacteria bacterium]
MKRARNILVVDDDPGVGRLLEEALRDQGYRPTVCAHPKEGLLSLERGSFGLAFIDINLPEMNGLELASRVKERDPLCEIVFITGSGSFENAVQAIKLGAYDYLRKPFSLNEFQLCMRRFQERQALKEQVRAAEQRYYQLVQSIPVLIYVLRRDMGLEFVNATCSTLLGYEQEEALGTPGWILQCVSPEDRERVRRAFGTAFRTGTPVSLECRLTHKSGYPVHALVKSMSKTSGRSGHTEGADHLEGFMVDITDRVLLERTLVQREKLKTLGAISAEVAHEIRNPLVAIGGFARRLQKKLPQVAECGIIVRESERLEAILSRIGNYLKPVEVHPRECSINRLITDALDLLEPEMEARMITAELDLDAALPAAYMDPEMLSQVFINLIRNGMEAAARGEVLRVRSYESERDLCVEFRNRGPEGKVADPESFFMPFSEGGRSIGLPLCSRLLRDIGGVLSFSQEEDFIVFVVTLPKGAQGKRRQE